MKILLALFFLLCATVLPAQSDNSIAEYPEGAEGFFDYLRTAMHYPPDALTDSVQGVVLVGFTVTSTGAIDENQIQVVKSLSPSCDTEALRLVAASRDWRPAKENGVAVSQRIVFPVEFKLP